MIETKHIQITSGRGPAECHWVTAKVLKHFLVEARAQNFNAEVLHREEGSENSTLVSAIIQLEGKALDLFLEQWVGTIQWIGKSQYRKFHKRKNWFIGVNLLNLSNTNYTIKDSELRFETSRASGAGGQHVNKVETAVRVVHIPTGISTTCSESRSQHQNRKKAKEKLIQLLKIKQLEQHKKDIATGWQNHNELQRGNPVKVFHGSDFKLKPKSKSYKSKRNQLKSDLKNQLKA